MYLIQSEHKTKGVISRLCFCFILITFFTYNTYANYTQKDSILNNGVIAFKANNYEASILLFKNLLKSDSVVISKKDSIICIAYIATCYSRLGDNDKEIKYWRRLYKLDQSFDLNMLEETTEKDRNSYLKIRQSFNSDNQNESKLFSKNIDFIFGFVSILLTFLAVLFGIKTYKKSGSILEYETKINKVRPQKLSPKINGIYYYNLILSIRNKGRSAVTFHSIRAIFDNQLEKDLENINTYSMRIESGKQLMVEIPENSLFEFSSSDHLKHIMSLHNIDLMEIKELKEFKRTTEELINKTTYEELRVNQIYIQEESGIKHFIPKKLIEKHTSEIIPLREKRIELEKKINSFRHNPIFKNNTLELDAIIAKKESQLLKDLLLVTKEKN